MTVAEIKAPETAHVDNVRAQVKAIMAAEGLNQAEIAKEAGIAYGTFTPWMTGKYGGNNEGVAEKVEKWLKSREESRRMQATLVRAPDFVRTPTAVETLSLLQWAKAAPGITLIVLGTGMGKTMSSKHFESVNPHTYRIVMRRTTSSPYSMMREIAHMMGVPERDPGKLSRAIGEKLRRNGRHTLIMIDEAQNLSDEAVDELRYYHDEYGAGIALLGNEDVQTRWGRGTPKEGYGQLHRRIGPRLRKLRVSDGDLDAYIAAWGIEDPGMIKVLKVIGRKAGALGQISATLQMASILAAGDGRAMTADDIKAAWLNRGGEDV